MADIMNNEPHIVRVKDFRIDADYAAWLTEIKRRYHSAQIKAAVRRYKRINSWRSLECAGATL